VVVVEDVQSVPLNQDLQTGEERPMETTKRTVVIVIVTIISITLGIVLAYQFSGAASERPLYTSPVTNPRH
jgi:hypothetical protein